MHIITYRLLIYMHVQHLVRVSSRRVHYFDIEAKNNKTYIFILYILRTNSSIITSRLRGGTIFYYMGASKKSLLLSFFFVVSNKKKNTLQRLYVAVRLIIFRQGVKIYFISRPLREKFEKLSIYTCVYIGVS